jgi:NDP-4-keto-2,6-dideoxyhexose 3-C-methyltransferase
MVRKINVCRICGNDELVPVVDLGEQYLTGVFPRPDEITNITKGPLKLVKCHSGDNSCGLLQLEHSYELSEMYGDNYGYRSGLNKSMVSHLKNKVKNILNIVNLNHGDLVIDIGSNDGTTLSEFNSNLHLVGIDPTGEKFKEYYPEHVELISDFFTDKLIRESYPNKNAKVITSFSMFYDLESPQEFVDQISNILDQKEGIWVFEQSYMPLMLERKSYDTICHEHLEYYGLEQIIWLLDRAKLKIIDVELNDINGGSFSVTATHKNSQYLRNDKKINQFLLLEKRAKLNTIEPYLNFHLDAQKSRNELKEFISNSKNNGQTISALGASTKGNVILQYCNIDSSQIDSIGEVNANKFGTLTPGSLIPIDSEESVLSKESDYLMVLPWHFRDFFVKNIKFNGRKLVFPLPGLEIIIPNN